MHEQVKFHITSVSPLKMHNGRLADPLNPTAKMLKELSNKRKKTDSDHEEMSRLDFYGGIYTGDDGCVIVSGEALEATIKSAAKHTRQGKMVDAAVFCDGDFPLIYDGPKTVDGLWADPRFHNRCRVGVNGKAVMRTRPIFLRWELDFTVHFLPSLLNRKDVINFVKLGGQIIGLLDHRPKFGRYEVTKIY